MLIVWPSVGQVLAMCWPCVGPYCLVVGVTVWCWSLVDCVLAVVAFTPVVSFVWSWLLGWLFGLRLVGVQAI